MNACATMDQADCEAANWHDVGLQDGEQGKKSRHYAKRQKQCRAFGIPVDVDAYQDGWQLGIKRYCTENNGYQVGVSGGFYAHSCPAASKHVFFSAYQVGRNIHTHQAKLDRLQRKIEDLGDRLAKDELSTEERSRLRSRRKDKKKDASATKIRLILAKLEAKKLGYPARF